MNTELQNFIETLLHEAHGEEITADARQLMIMDLYPKLEESLSLAMFAKLSPEQLEKVETMALAEVPQEQIQHYLTEVVPDHKVVLEEALRDFWAMYILPEASNEKTR